MTRPEGNIGKRVVHSSAWLYGRRLVSSFFNLFVIALLARKLTPADFGLVALAGVTLKLLTSVGPVGVGSYIIYDRAEGREERVHAAFWLNVTLTLAITALALVLVPLAARYYAMRELGPILYLLLAQFALGQLAGVPDALIQRALDFKKLVLREIVLDLVNGAAMVSMALTGCGVWSLIVPSAILTPVRVALGFKLAGWTPTLPLRRHSWPGIFRYSFHTAGSSLVSFLANEGDTMIIGKRFGATDLGFYNRAWASANMVGSNVTSVVANVALPALSAVSDDMARLRAALNRMLRTLALASFPLLVGLLIVADLFVLTLYGPKWQPSILPLQILIIFALRQTVGSPAAVIYQAVGRPDIGFKMGLIFLPFYFLSIWLGSSYGIVGVALGVTVARTAYGMVQFAVVARLVKQAFWQLLAPMGQPLLAAGMMGLLVALCRIGLQNFGISAPAKLAVLVLFGGAVWVLLLARVFPVLLEEGLKVTDNLPRAVSSPIRRILKPVMA